MIRYIDLTEALGEDGYNFAFWDTITNSFLELEDEQAWETWDDFIKVAHDISLDRVHRCMELYKSHNK